MARKTTRRRTTRSSVPNRRTPKRKAPGRKSSQRKAPVKRRRQPAGARPSSGEARARIRVYRHGLGDCILVRLRQRDGNDFKILIDCGVALATQKAPAMMAKVMGDVLATTGGEIDVLAVTHEHWDHVSGFMQAEEIFQRLKVAQVWVAWTEDPGDALAKSLRKEHTQAVRALVASANAMELAGRDDRALEIRDLVALFGAAGEKTGAAFDIAKKASSGNEPLYCRPTDQPFRPPNTDAKIYVLGPPHDAKLIRKVLPSKAHPETYELALDGRGVFPLGVYKALFGARGDTGADGDATTDAHNGTYTDDAAEKMDEQADEDEADQPPFAVTVTIPMENARALPFFQQRYWNAQGDDARWRNIDSDWLGAADDLALAMQSATNNTSLVLAIELDGGDVLLFVGDAQVGNWLSWQTWGSPHDDPKVTGPQLLERTIFYKVGHHGSHNATLRDKGLALMTNLKTAVIPVDQEVAKKMRWGAMPLERLVKELDGRTKGRTLRTDRDPKGPLQGITVEELYFEVAV